MIKLELHSKREYWVVLYNVTALCSPKRIAYTPPLLHATPAVTYFINAKHNILRFFYINFCRTVFITIVSCYYFFMCNYGMVLACSAGVDQQSLRGDPGIGGLRRVVELPVVASTSRSPVENGTFSTLRLLII